MNKVKDKQIESINMGKVTLPDASNNKFRITKSIGEIVVPTSGPAQYVDVDATDVWDLLKKICQRDNQPTLINPNINISSNANNQYVEVGTTVNPTINVTYIDGIMQYNNPTAAGCPLTELIVGLYNNKTLIGETINIELPYTNPVHTWTHVMDDYDVLQVGAYGNYGQSANTAVTQLGNVAEISKIQAGSFILKSLTTYIAYRAIFYGTMSPSSQLNSANIRALGVKRKTSDSIVVYPTTNDRRIVVAIPKTMGRTGITTAMRPKGGSGGQSLADYTTKSTVTVNSASGDPIDYYVWDILCGDNFTANLEVAINFVA